MQNDFEALWKIFQTPLKAYVKKRIQNPSDTEDVLQNIFLKIYTSMNQVSDRAKIHAWIFAVTRNEINDYYRKSKHSVVPAEIPEDIPEEISEDTTDNAEKAACLKGMIDLLPDIYRDAIILTEFQGYSQKELAEEMEISLSGAKSRVQRGREKLKNMLQKCCTFETDHYGNIIDYKKKDCTFC